MTRKPETNLFVECKEVGINQDGVFIPITEIPKIEKAIKEWKKNKSNQEKCKV